ncbi:EamA family transporter [Chlorogloeopsis sp. ULAP01]|uniref:DMT family transporter n=1 Tax=Chlorogloeopsis sp. ULAP01 TaxID=3056483 RepID=UPI0025AB1A38|nr:DMT family transporter [Chlorogloeopsis sp. ULAP01]MDM9384163.1 EamA family transporter [Chlorogloeopsis sp. ULAP01]
MGRFEKRSENSRIQGDPFGEADTALRALTDELQIIQRTLLKSLREDVKQLQGDKIRLSEDVKRLQQEKEELLQGLQASEMQGLLRQLAQVLATHISSQLQSSLEAFASQAIEPSSEGSNNSITENEVRQLLGSLDDSLTITFHTLQHELKNYQSSLSRQLSQMSMQQQQGEEILAELVNRLRTELEKTTTESLPTVIQAESAIENEFFQKGQQGGFEAVTKLQQDTIIIEPNTPQTSLSSTPSTASSLVPRKLQKIDNISPSSSALTITPSQSPSVPKQKVTPAPAPTSSMPVTTTSLSVIGVCLLVLSTVVSSLYNIAIKVIFHSDTQIFGVFDVKQLLLPTLGNILLILTLRMLVVVPMMLVLAPMLHSQVWEDLQNLIESSQKKRYKTHNKYKQVLFLSVLSGCFLFLSQVLIYSAVSQLPTGMAIALFFIYPAIGGLLGWFLFRDRPTSARLIAIACICLGQMLVLGGSTSIGSDVTVGGIIAIASGVAFAIYVILTRICAAKIHPVTFTLINFATMLLLSFVSLILTLPTNWSLQLQSNNLIELILSAFILGVFTLCGYLFNNVGIRKVGASRSALLGATVPALTTIFAALIIQESLQLVQVLGVVFVTCGVAAFSYEKIRNNTKTSQTTS